MDTDFLHKASRSPRNISVQARRDAAAHARDRRFFSEALRDVCRELGFKTVTNAILGVLHRPQMLHGLNRTLWHLDEPLSLNVQNLRVDGQYFESLTGRSVLG